MEGPKEVKRSEELEPLHHNLQKTPQPCFCNQSLKWTDVMKGLSSIKFIFISLLGMESVNKAEVESNEKRQPASTSRRRGNVFKKQLYLRIWNVVMGVLWERPVKRNQ